MGIDWHKKQVAAAILIPFIHQTRLDWLKRYFYIWNQFRLKIFAILNDQAKAEEEATKLSGADMAEIFERENAKHFSGHTIPSKWDDTPEHPPWHPAVNIRMPTLPTAESIGAVGTKNGKLKILSIDRWNYWKERMVSKITIVKQEGETNTFAIPIAVLIFFYSSSLLNFVHTFCHLPT